MKKKYKAWPFPTEEEKMVSSSVLQYDWPVPTTKLETKTPFKEADPSGKTMHEPGAKADAGKNRTYLFLKGFANALEKVSEVTTVGAAKYSPDGWKHVPDGYARYMDAFGRHLLEYSKGEKLDAGVGGTGCHHMAQMIWNLLAAFELELESE